MITLPPRAQLGKDNGGDTIPSSQLASASSSQSVSLATPLAIPQSAPLLTHSTDSFPRGANLQSTARPSLYSNSPFSGSTLCPTPVSVRSEYEDKNAFEDIHFKKKGSVTSFGKKLDPASYSVETLQQNDDAGLIPTWKRHLYRLSPFTTFAAMVSYFSYYIYRIHCTLDAQRLFHQTYIMAWVFICAEGCVACECVHIGVIRLTVTDPTIFHQFYQMLSIRPRNRPKLRLRGDNAPTVDVFITCCKEDIDVVLDTTRAACATDYPEDRFRVVLLDDGKDRALEKAVEDLRLEYPNLYYHSRLKVKGAPHHFKAGNLSDGTNFVTKLDGGEGEYIAALDADMIPDPDWLRALIGHVVKDGRLALVCLPQVCLVTFPS